MNDTRKVTDKLTEYETLKDKINSLNIEIIKYAEALNYINYTIESIEYQKTRTEETPLELDKIVQGIEYLEEVMRIFVCDESCNDSSVLLIYLRIAYKHIRKNKWTDALTFLEDARSHINLKSTIIFNKFKNYLSNLEGMMRYD